MCTHGQQYQITHVNAKLVGRHGMEERESKIGKGFLNKSFLDVSSTGNPQTVRQAGLTGKETFYHFRVSGTTFPRIN